MLHHSPWRPSARRWRARLLPTLPDAPELHLSVPYRLLRGLLSHDEESPSSVHCINRENAMGKVLFREGVAMHVILGL